MQYLGGKHFLAKQLAAAMRAEQGNACVWEPFCGGLNVTAELAKHSAGVASDVHPALMALYFAMRDSGWEPPEHVSEGDYQAAKLFPDTDPRKAFCGFGCSFGGKWFAGLSRPRPKQRNPYGAARSALMRKIAATRQWLFVRGSFFDFSPAANGGFIYCDPPYAGTTEYSMSFDSAAFWRRAQDWARIVPVYVSEFVCPVPARLVLEIDRPRSVSANTGMCTDRLFQVSAQ